MDWGDTTNLREALLVEVPNRADGDPRLVALVRVRQVDTSGAFVAREAPFVPVRSRTAGVHGIQGIIGIELGVPLVAQVIDPIPCALVLLLGVGWALCPISPHMNPNPIFPATFMLRVYFSPAHGCLG